MGESMAAEHESNEVTEPNERSRAMDAELRAIGGILRILEEMSEGGRRRAVAYLSSRYGFPDE